MNNCVNGVSQLLTRGQNFWAMQCTLTALPINWLTQSMGNDTKYLESQMADVMYQSFVAPAPEGLSVVG